MRRDDLATVLLVKSFEDEDGDGRLLPLADREAAAREAARGAGASPEPGLRHALLAARARILHARLAARYPVVEGLRTLGRGMPAIEGLLLLLGLVAGFALSALDGPRRIEIFSLPLAALLTWNFAVYALVAARSVRRADDVPRTEGLAAAIARIPAGFAARVVSKARSFDAPLAGALQRFAAAWFPLSLPVQRARAARAMHLAAAAVGAGLIAGLYLRGLVLDYRAGWESTFLTPERAATLVKAFFTPAAWLTGMGLPHATELDAMRWPKGEPAARWIHLIAVTVLATVVLPRLLLALRSAFVGWRRAADMAVPADFEAYFRRAFTSIESIVPRARALVMPYAHTLGAPALARLIAALGAEAGGRIDVEAADPLPYGEEERWLAGFAARGDPPDLLVMPFALATTPEDENHGRVIEGARDALAAARREARLVVMVDESEYRRRMAGAPERVAERREAWKAFAAARGVDIRFVELGA